MFHVPAHKNVSHPGASFSPGLKDLYKKYLDSVLKKAANRERVVSLGFEDWFGSVYRMGV